MNNEKLSRPFNVPEPKNPAYNKGYWDGFELYDKDNPYPIGSSEWEDYEAGWEEGWLDA